MIKLIAYAVLSGIFSASFMSNPPTVTTKEEFEKHYDQKVILVGTYTPLMLPESKRPNSKKINSGRVSIRLGDFDVALDRDKKGLRSKQEVKKFSGKKVKVKGTIQKMVTLWGDGTQQSIIMPAILEIESIEISK